MAVPIARDARDRMAPRLLLLTLRAIRSVQSPSEQRDSMHLQMTKIECV